MRALKSYASCVACEGRGGGVTQWWRYNEGRGFSFTMKQKEEDAVNCFQQPPSWEHAGPGKLAENVSGRLFQEFENVPGQRTISQYAGQIPKKNMRHVCSGIGCKKVTRCTVSLSAKTRNVSSASKSSSVR